MAIHHKAFLAVTAGVFVALVADQFVASILNPILTPLKITYA